MNLGPCFSKNLPFHGPGDLVSLEHAYLITDTVPCPKLQKLGRRISNPKHVQQQQYVVLCMGSRQCPKPAGRDIQKQDCVTNT